MGRPLKKGLHYFNIDCVQEDKLNYIEAKHGITGYGVWVKLLRKIYMIEGYFCEWSEKNLYIFSKEIGVDPELVKTIVETCICEGLFHRETLDKHGVLTSPGIQKRYLRIVSEAKRKGCDIDQKYALNQLAPEETKVITGGNGSNSGEIKEESTQKKRKESKGKKKKVLNPTGGAPAVPVKKIRKVEESEPHWQSLVNTWFAYCQEKFGEHPSFDGELPRIFKRIITRLKNRAAKQSVEWTEETACQRLKIFLTSAYSYDEWLPKHFTLQNLEKQFDPVVLKQKDAAKKNNSGSGGDVQYLYDRFLEGNLDSRVITEQHFKSIAATDARVISLMQQQIPKRIKQLMGGNEAKDLRLYEAYQRGRETEETKADTVVVMRMAVMEYFKLKKDENAGLPATA